MENTHRRHDISNRAWSILKPNLSGQRGQWGGISKDNRLFINAVFWILRTGASWRDLPPDYGKWGTVYQRFRRWSKKGVLAKILKIFAGEPDLNQLDRFRFHFRNFDLLESVYTSVTFFFRISLYNGT